ncbi:hypothetical protein A966_07484 [Brachyspira hampsonii 30446]|uniref:AlgX/AlgJ SGNH hydrolase-like domain-containing protein n=2 Tax=Brachyspira hampsonii TaxID=1287055 RepID=A0A2U4EZ30_9SPIR|nr:hypothetical protein [Brachyspira hampsonii]EKV56862.1 hypothetical protein A966_07484 [Brachyspira hampsonii 30446]
MKLKKVLISIYVSLLILFVISLIVLSILGSKERIGYLSYISLNTEETLNNNSINTNNITNIEEYIFTNNSITNYIYNFRINYYDKVFRNSDIYDVYLNTNSLPDYIKDVKFVSKGSPFGALISSKKIEGNIDNIKYSLKLKFSNLFLYLILFYIFVILVYIFRKSLFNILHYIVFISKKYMKLLLIYFIIYIFILFSLFILGKVSRVGYLSDISLSIEETLNNNFINANNIKNIEEYILTNNSMTNYVYNFRISYYDKVFRNSDIYGVYLNTNSLPDYIKDMKFVNKGSPFGTLISSDKIEGNIDNIKYSLKLKLTFLITILLFFIFALLIRPIILEFVSLIKIRINLKNIYVYILIIFLCFLIMPNIIYILFGSYFDNTNYENRLKANKPILSINNLSKYPNEYEKYFNDYLPFRNELIQLKNIIDFLIFNNILSQSAILGKNKWVFFKEIRYVIQNYIGIYRFSDEELENAKNNLLHFRNELRKKNIDFVFMICPDKTLIYADYMPYYVKRKTMINAAEQFVNYIRKNTDIKIVYPKEELLKYKDTYLLYYKYDYHWNYLGAYIGYSEFMKTVGINVPEIYNRNIILTNMLPFYKDLTSFINLYSFLKKDIEKIYTISGYNNYNIIEGTNVFSQYVLVKPKLNTNVINRKLFVIRDSFSQAMFEYLSSSFSQASYRHIDRYKNSEIIKEYPDIVLFETVDSFLKESLFKVIPNYKIEEINKDLETNSATSNN